MNSKTDVSPRRGVRKAARDQFPLTRKLGSVSVKIYRHREKGRYDVFTVVYYQGGERMRSPFTSLESAQAEADLVLAKLSRGEPDVLTLTSADRLEYLRAKQTLNGISVPLDIAVTEYVYAQQRLAGHGSLADAVAVFLRMRPAAPKPAAVRQVVDELLIAREADGSSKRHIDDLRSRLTPFAVAFGCRISDVTAGELSAYLLSIKGESRTKNNHRTAISNLFSFARLNGYVSKDSALMTDVPQSKEPRKPVEVYTVQELRSMLRLVKDGFLPYLVIAAFAGLRQSEIERLDWRDIGDKYIRVPPGERRVKSVRLVCIQPNLARWLAGCRQPEGRVVFYKKGFFDVCSGYQP